VFVSSVYVKLVTTVSTTTLYLDTVNKNKMPEIFPVHTSQHALNWTELAKMSKMDVTIHKKFPVRILLHKLFLNAKIMINRK